MAEQTEQKPNVGRGLLTDAERAALTGERSDSYRYKTRSYLRDRIEQVERDAEVLAEHAPDLLAELQAAVDTDDTQPPRDGRDSVETPSTEQPDQTDAVDAATPSTTEAATLAVEEVDLPEGHTPESVADAYAAVREHLRAEGPSTKTEIVQAVMPEHPLGYDDADALDRIDEGARYRGAWWRKIIQPALDADPEVDHRANHHDYNL